VSFAYTFIILKIMVIDVINTNKLLFINNFTILAVI